MGEVGEWRARNAKSSLLRVDVFIVSYARTPFGSFQGALAGFSACELGGMAIKAAVERAGLAGKMEAIDEVIMGNVMSAGLGQAPASTAARLGGVPSSVPSSSVNKVCASGMKAIMLASNAIRAGQANIIVAGGMESMTRAPYLLPAGVRTGGLRYGDQALVDSLRLDGLTDEASGQPMGCCGELCADEYGISRESSDAYARGTFERAIEAQRTGLFSKEIVPISVTKGGKGAASVDSDQGPDSVRYKRGHGQRVLSNPASLSSSRYSTIPERCPLCAVSSRRTGR